MKKNFLSWSDAYDQCLNKVIDGILMKISSVEQFNALKSADTGTYGEFILVRSK